MRRKDCPIEQLRWRLTNGAPAEGDLDWCRQRLRALSEWPDALDEQQRAEITVIEGWLS